MYLDDIHILFDSIIVTVCAKVTFRAIQLNFRLSLGAFYLQGNSVVKSQQSEGNGR